MMRSMIFFRNQLGLLKQTNRVLGSWEKRGLATKKRFSTALESMPEVQVIDINFQDMMLNDPEDYKGQYDTGNSTNTPETEKGGDFSFEIQTDPNALIISDTLNKNNAGSPPESHTLEASVVRDINPLCEPEKPCTMAPLAPVDINAGSPPESHTLEASVVGDINPLCEPEKPPMLAPIAPVDINGWEDEEAVRDGTVDYEAIEKMKKLYELPPIPEKRSGVYQFKGIKIVLPQRMLTPATYKYKLCEEDENLPDDTRICHFEPLEGVPVNGKPIDDME